MFVDEPVSIVGHADWSADERHDAGAIATSPDDLTAALQAPLPTNLDPSSTNFLVRSQLQDSPYYVNSESFARTFVHSDMQHMALVVYNHGVSDWRDVLKYRVNVPVAFFTGEYSANVPSQRWAQSVVKNSKLYVYTKAEQGDHFLMFKNPFKFTSDLQAFLNP
ncbi:MAG: alpha/beta hydrolase [Rhizomicrobium sp.]